MRIKVNDPSKTDVLKCYANTESVHTVPELHEKTKNEYLRDRLLRKISGYQEEIEKLKDTYDQNKQKIAALEDKNRQLEEGKKYQTAEEIEKTNQEIQTNKNQLETLKTEQENNLKDQDEYNLRIVKTQEQADDLIWFLQLIFTRPGRAAEENLSYTTGGRNWFRPYLFF